MTNKNSIALTLLCILNFQSLIMQAMNQPDYTSEFAELYTSSLLGNNGWPLKDNFAEYLQKFDAANHTDNPAALYDYVGDFKGNNNISLFESAIIAQDIAAVKKLTTHGANLHKTICNMYTPLHHVLHSLNIDLATILIKAGADVHSEKEKYPNDYLLFSKYARVINFYNYYLNSDPSNDYSEGMMPNTSSLYRNAYLYVKEKNSDTRKDYYKRMQFLATTYKVQHVIDALTMVHDNEAIERILHTTIATYDYKTYDDTDINPADISSIDTKAMNNQFAQQYEALYKTQNVSSDVDRFNGYVDKFNKVVRSKLPHLFCTYIANYKNTSLTSSHTLYEELLHTSNHEGLRLLVSKHANKNKEVFDSKLALVYALGLNNFEIAKIFISAHRDCIKDRFIGIPKYNSSNSVPIVQLLIDHGCDVNYMECNTTSLTFAMRNKNYDMIHLLKDKVNETTLQHALQSPYCKPDMRDILQAVQESKIAQKAFLENNSKISQFKRTRVVRLEKGSDEDWSWRNDFIGKAK